MTWKCVIDYDIMSDQSVIRLAAKYDNGQIDFICGPAKIKRYEEGDLLDAEPILRLQYDDMKRMLQSVVDAAWDFGVRPSGVKDYESSNQAQKYHLEDMRSLVKKFTEADLK